MILKSETRLSRNDARSAAVEFRGGDSQLRPVSASSRRAGEQREPRASAFAGTCARSTSATASTAFRVLLSSGRLALPEADGGGADPRLRTYRGLVQAVNDSLPDARPAVPTQSRRSPRRIERPAADVRTVE